MHEHTQTAGAERKVGQTDLISLTAFAASLGGPTVSQHIHASTFWSIRRARAHIHTRLAVLTRQKVNK